MSTAKLIALAIIITASGFYYGCGSSSLNENHSKIHITAGEIKNLAVNGIPSGNKTSIQEFSTVQKLKLYASIARNKAEVTFDAEIHVQNISAVDVSVLKLSSLKWNFVLHNKEAASGEDDRIYQVPDSGMVKIDLIVKIDVSKIYPGEKTETAIDRILKIFSSGPHSGDLKFNINGVISNNAGKRRVRNELLIF